MTTQITASWETTCSKLSSAPFSTPPPPAEKLSTYLNVKRKQKHLEPAHRLSGQVKRYNIMFL